MKSDAKEARIPNRFRNRRLSIEVLRLPAVAELAVTRSVPPVLEAGARVVLAELRGETLPQAAG